MYDRCWPIADALARPPCRSACGCPATSWPSSIVVIAWSRACNLDEHPNRRDASLALPRTSRSQSAIVPSGL